MAHVFVSYVREDQSAVDLLCDLLRDRGVEVWLDRTSIRPGQRWRDAIREAIRGGDFFIACFSRNSEARRKTYMNEELLLAVDELRQYALNQTWFIPVLLDDAPLPQITIGPATTLSDLQHVNFHANKEEAVRRIVDVVSPIDPQEQRWKQRYTSYFIRGLRTRCSECGTAYQIENLDICCTCSGAYCYHCVRSLTRRSNENEPPVYECRCGGATRALTAQESKLGLAIWRRHRDENQA